MPTEIHQVHIKPADFFTRNPAIDVPGKKNETSVLAPGACCEESSGKLDGDVQEAAASHLQGAGPDLNPVSKVVVK